MYKLCYCLCIYQSIYENYTTVTMGYSLVYLTLCIGRKCISFTKNSVGEGASVNPFHFTTLKHYSQGLALSLVNLIEFKKIICYLQVAHKHKLRYRPIHEVAEFG